MHAYYKNVTLCDVIVSFTFATKETPLVQSITQLGALQLHHKAACVDMMLRDDANAVSGPVCNASEYCN